MMRKYKVQVDVQPNGLLYGFPMTLPEEAITGIELEDIKVKDNFDLKQFIFDNGYPEELYRKHRTFIIPIGEPEDKYDPDVHGGGVESFGSYYPGGCAQE